MTIWAKVLGLHIEQPVKGYNPMKASKKKSAGPKKNVVPFVSQYVNPKTGKLMRAKDYGYKAWPFGRRKAA